MSVHILHEHTEIISHILFRNNCQGTEVLDSLTLEENKDDKYGEIYTVDKSKLPERGLIINGYFSNESECNEACIEIINFNINFISMNVTRSDNTNWEEEWKKDYNPIRINSSLRIITPWMEYNKDTDVIIEPSNGYGTGSHPTTFLCANILADLIKKDDIVVDMGCGSGILSIISSKLGAKEIFSIDADIEALSSCRKNIELNKCENINVIHENNLKFLNTKVDVIVANIVPDILLKLLDDFYDVLKTGGKAILAGINKDNIDLMLNALKEKFDIEKISNIDNWTAIIVSRKR